MVGELLQCEVAVIGEDDHRAHSLAGPRIREANNGDVGDAVMSDEHLLNLGRRDVLGVPDDEVLDPTGDADIAIPVDKPEITGAEPSILVECIHVEGRVKVPGKALRSFQTQLAFPVDLELPAILGDHPYDDPGNGHPDCSVKPLRRIRGPRRRGDRELGQAHALATPETRKVSRTA